MEILVLDVGTSSVRATVLDEAMQTISSAAESLVVDRTRAGVVEFDAEALAVASERVARAAIEASGGVDGVAIAAQRASTILFEAESGRALGLGISWEDLRTTGHCLALHARGLRLSPSQSATKLAFLLASIAPKPGEARFGTVETFLAYRLTNGEAHLTDATNAGLTGLVTPDASEWDDSICAELRIDPALLPRIVDTAGELALCPALPGAPVLAALVGDQQASLVGQGCLRPGQAKLTFGTGGMLDLVVGSSRPQFPVRGPQGTFPVVAHRIAGATIWGLEAVMLAAGSAIAWLRDGLALIDDVAETDALAASARDAGGVVFVPALGGIGAPEWDYGARGTLVGISAATTRAEVVRAVLEGVAQRGADLVAAAEADAGCSIGELRVDGGMTANATFLSLLASAINRPVLPSARLEATTLGAAFLAGVALGAFANLEATATFATHRPAVEPGALVDRPRWLALRERAFGVVPALSALDF